MLLKNNALGTSAGVCGHGAAGRAGGTAPTARQAPPFHIGMGEAAEVAGDGGPPARDGGAGDTCALRCGRRATGPAAEHTAAGRRVRPGRTSAAASPLSASRADEEQLPASTEQVRERRARVGGWRGERRGERRRRWCGGRGQEGRAAAEGDAMVGEDRRAHLAALPAGAAAAVRDGPPPGRVHPPAAAARRVTSPPRRPYHAYIPLSGRSDGRSGAQARPPVLHARYLFIWDAGRVPCRTCVLCVDCGYGVRRVVFLAPSPSRAITKTEINKDITLLKSTLKYVVLGNSNRYNLKYNI